MRILAKTLLAVAIVAAIGCDDDEIPTAPTPTPPTTVTDTFTGTLNKNGAASHNFFVTTTGTAANIATLSATLKTLSPDPELVVGFAVGTWSGSACNVVLVRDRAVQTTVIYGNVNVSGELCVRVYDVGNVIEPVEYSIEVVHP